MMKAAFGAGCFWGTEKFFRKQFGNALTKTAVGYMGGNTLNPTYEQVCTGRTGHAEVLYVEYDENKVKYNELVDYFFRMHDPTTKNRQGNDRGTQYRSTIFYYTPEQEQLAQQRINELQSTQFKDTPIQTTLEPAGEFFRAEDYHQLYLENNPNGYCNHYLRW